MNDRIKTLFLSPSLSRNLGGIYEIIRSLSMELQRNGVDIRALGLRDEGWELDQVEWGDIPTRVFSYSGPRVFGFSSGLRDEVMKSDADLLHLHALWMHTSVIASEWKKCKKRPYMVTPNGMLEPWALRNSGWKKRIAAFFYENRMLHGASCLQANTIKEFNDFRAYGLTQPIAIIPNGVDLPEEEQEMGDRSWEIGLGGRLSTLDSRPSTPRTLLFLGRIHPKKGLPNLIRGFKQALDARRSTLDSAPWRLVIAGWDQGGHEAELMKLCQELGISVERRGSSVEVQKSEAEVVFWGAAFGAEKKSLLRSADAFVLPSFSEGLPMSVLEAWSYRLPVVMTPECNLPEGFAADAAIRIETGTESIAQGLDSLFSMNESDLQSMGAKGRALVEERFTWKTIAAQMREVYDWMLGGGETPGAMIGDRG
jgi:glycosyltransferase involved in cell wall biosynthesis